VLGFLAVLAGCGGGGGALGDSNDGRLVIRSTVSLRGGVSLGTERLLSGGQCVALTLEDQVQHQAAVDEAGAYLLLVPPSFEGCAAIWRRARAFTLSATLIFRVRRLGTTSLASIFRR
jgi:hypothetical protein